MLKAFGKNSVFPFFRKRLCELMSSFRVSHYTLAKAIGVESEEIATYLSGKKTPKLNILQRLGRYFDISPAYLFSEKSLRVLVPITNGFESKASLDKLYVKLKDFYLHMSEIMELTSFTYQFSLDFGYNEYKTIDLAGKALQKEKIGLVITTFPKWFYGAILSEKGTKCIIVSNKEESLQVIKYLNDQHLSQKRTPTLIDEIYMHDTELKIIPKYDTKKSHATLKCMDDSINKIKSLLLEDKKMLWSEKRIREGFIV